MPQQKPGGWGKACVCEKSLVLLGKLVSRRAVFARRPRPDARRGLAATRLNEERHDMAAVHEGLHFLVARPFGNPCCGIEDERQYLDIGDGVQENAGAPEGP